MAQYSKKCDSASFVLVAQDDENVSQMKYLYDIYKRYSYAQTRIDEMSKLKLGYTMNCTSTFKISD